MRYSVIGKKEFAAVIVVTVTISLYMLYRNRGSSLQSRLRQYSLWDSGNQDAEHFLGGDQVNSTEASKSEQLLVRLPLRPDTGDKDFLQRNEAAESNSSTEHKTLNETFTLKPTGQLTVEMTNPGCTHRKMSYYVPKRAPSVYHHPPLVHYAKFSSGKTATLSYMEYMAMLSAYKFLKPERILIHSDVDIHGEYWERTQKWSGTSVEVNRVSRVGKLGGNIIHYIEHEADYVKLKQLLKHGGVTSDFDVLIVNGTKLKEQQRVSECVLSRQKTKLNNGFNSCIKNSSYIRVILEGYARDYRPNAWVYNCAIFPAQILEDKKRTCYNVYLDSTVSLNPSWYEASKLWLSPNGAEWRNKTAAHYFVKDGFPNSEEILKGNHSLAEVFRYVHDS